MKRTEFGCAACILEKNLLGRYPCEVADCLGCNSNASFVQYWRRRIRREGLEGLAAQRRRLLQQVHLMDVTHAHYNTEANTHNE
jgi:hypothetical protein